MLHIRNHFFSPSRTILLSMAFAILGGTALLMLPGMTTKAVSTLDLLFTATSAICVTGFLTVPLSSFTPLGHSVIMILIQIGGLGLITLTLFIISLFTNLGLATQVMAGEMLDLETWSGARRILVFIIALTLLCEVGGALLLFQSFKHQFPFYTAVFYSVFHSISAFCNSGFTIFPEGMLNYTHDYLVLATTSGLILMGSIGFITLKELFLWWAPWQERTRKVFSLQTRIIVHYMVILTIGSTILFWLLERQGTFAHMSFGEQIMNSFFTAVSSRGAGFLTVYGRELQYASLLILMINSFIGAAPGSTGSGIKVTTLALFMATIHSAIQGKHSVDIKGRRIMKDQIYKALAIVALSLLWILLVTFCLLITERSWQFLDILLETVNAFTTLGVSIGITPYLSILGKLLIIVTMFIGRIGSLTLMIALRTRTERTEFSYPEERVMIS